MGIVIPVRDRIKFFKLCLHSVLGFTDVPYTIVVVDNQCGFKMRNYLQSCEKNHGIKVVRYDSDFNFAAEVNLGLLKAFENPNVEYGLVLNSDAVVSPFWLSNMMEVMKFPENANVGMVGPVSNAAIKEQSLMKGDMVVESSRLSGFCLLLRRKMFQDLSGFDESFVGGGYEDWDICVRAQKAGWKMAIDTRTHVHHFHRISRQGEEHDVTMNQNRLRFFDKWPEILQARPVMTTTLNGHKTS